MVTAAKMSASIVKRRMSWLLESDILYRVPVLT